MRQIRVFSTFLLSLFFLVSASVISGSCGSDSEAALTQAVKFHLDRREYSEAITKSEAILELNEDNHKARFFLATALAGQYYLGPDRTILGFFADYVRELEEDSGFLDALLSIRTPLETEDVPRVFDVQEVLGAIPSSYRSADVYFLAYMARLFEIAFLLEKLGAFSKDLSCNINPDNPFRDGIPDSISFANWSVDEFDRFRLNIAESTNDALNAGFLDSDLPVAFFAANVILMNSYIDDNSDLVLGVTEFLSDIFGLLAGESICTVDP